MSKPLSFVIVVLAVTGTTSRATGDTDSPTLEPAAWDRGVSDSDRAKARSLYGSGDEAYVNGRFAEALENYERAIEFWDHPKIHFNSARALVRIGKPLAAYQALGRAMRHGAAGLGDRTYDNAETMRDLLRGQLAELTVECETEGAVVTLDGEVLFHGPGRDTIVVSPGSYQIVAEKDGYERFVRRGELTAGATTAVGIALSRPAPPPIYARRWPAWQPWTLTGVGGGLLIGGLVLAFASEENYDRFDDGLRREPGCADGCSDDELPSELRDYRRTGDRQRIGSVVSLLAGAAVTTAGVIMLVKNERREIDVVAAPGRISVSATVRF